MTETPDPDPNITYVDDETWEWLQKRLNDPPQVNEKLRKLLKETEGDIEHR